MLPVWQLEGGAYDRQRGDRVLQRAGWALAPMLALLRLAESDTALAWQLADVRLVAVSCCVLGGGSPLADRVELDPSAPHGVAESLVSGIQHARGVGHGFVAFDAKGGGGGVGWGGSEAAPDNGNGAIQLGASS